MRAGIVAMVEPKPRPDSDAQRAADRLALVLEDIGFDVGREFPALSFGVDRAGMPVVELGAVTVTVADGLSAVLRQAASRGIVIAGEGAD
jgi:hypothetical protein